ncbi:MAG: hypothetical protein KKB30_13800 [Proteobacteria bacterium]|nr:hypothetical protein [Pseudomonadota bacterium]MBU1715923.1 hypothetical protein [Pseudomonadota bacterium]
MSSVEEIQPTGDKMRKAICWISETIQANPEKTRTTVIREAETRFDLSPKECDFLNNKFC